MCYLKTQIKSKLHNDISMTAEVRGRKSIFLNAILTQRAWYLSFPCSLECAQGEGL